MAMNLSLSEKQIQRFFSRSILARRMKFRCLQKEANRREINESNRFLSLTFIEGIAKNWRY